MLFCRVLSGWFLTLYQGRTMLTIQRVSPGFLLGCTEDAVLSVHAVVLNKLTFMFNAFT